MARSSTSWPARPPTTEPTGPRMSSAPPKARPGILRLAERMAPPLQQVLTFVPLAAYLYLLAIWQAGRSPRVVRGSTDVGLLALGVGGMVLFGPFGQTLARILFREPTTPQWMTLGLLAILVV